MKTLIFDFDSTLIDCESLEEILKSKGVDPEKFETITKEGMEGKIPFVDSLKKRLSLAPLTDDDIRLFGLKAVGHITAKMDALIDKFRGRGCEIYIISGSFKEAIYPVAETLKIPKDKVLALDLSGPYVDKRELAKQAKWSRPAIIVGDGMTDFDLVSSGYADKFVVFTRHVKRSAVLSKGEEAGSIEELEKILNRYEKNP